MMAGGSAGNEIEKSGSDTLIQNFGNSSLVGDPTINNRPTALQMGGDHRLSKVNLEPIPRNYNKRTLIIKDETH